MDEPTASMDTRTENDLYHILRRINRETTIVLVTHDLGFVSSIVKRVACLNRNLVCHPTSRLTPEIVEALYRGPVHVVQHEHILPAEASHD
jgi:zinc transport system ATP-binding protein